MTATTPLRCQDHAERLEAIETRLGAIEGKVDFIADVLRPHAKGPTLALETKWGKVRGSAPWVVVVLALSLAAAGGGYWATTAQATTPAASGPPAATAGP